MIRLRPEKKLANRSVPITPAGYAALQARYAELFQNERPKLVEIVSWAAGNGDRSENGDYQYGKKRLREIDRRVRYLQKRIPDLKVVDRPPDEPARIFFGAWIRLEDEAGKEFCYRLVGPDEFDPGKGWISIDSPLARALLKKTAGEEVRVALPKGEMEYYVVAVQYTPFSKNEM